MTENKSGIPSSPNGIPSFEAYQRAKHYADNPDGTPKLHKEASGDKNTEKPSSSSLPDGVPSFEEYRQAQYYTEHPEEALKLQEKIAAAKKAKEPIAPVAPQPRKKRVYGAGIPTFITQQMVTDLKEMGLTDEAIGKMTPSDALNVLR